APAGGSEPPVDRAVRRTFSEAPVVRQEVAVGGPDVDAPTRIQRALPFPFLDDRHVCQPGSLASVVGLHRPIRKLVKPTLEHVRREERSWSEGRPTLDGSVDQEDEPLCRLSPLPPIPVLSDMVAGLQDRAHREEERFSGLYLTPDLGLDLGKALTQVGNLE